ncbi:Protein of unknown function [Pyronema omphalodes CBS 100304]|uniref:Tc1-like transposase DDE domain-containing protein n=1 Tax=Pyronema omphalodes (strain CBS 100304) TaxID=1076935 RepID=U4LJ92_PYROM|nr:Protein of unknown function [Pyronema omphalodes CBS 100304]
MTPQLHNSTTPVTPILWPACWELLSKNPDFLLMEDNAASHAANFTTTEREKAGVFNKNKESNSDMQSVCS